MKIVQLALLLLAVGATLWPRLLIFWSLSDAPRKQRMVIGPVEVWLGVGSHCLLVGGVAALLLMISCNRSFLPDRDAVRIPWWLAVPGTALGFYILGWGLYLRYLATYGW